MIHGPALPVSIWIKMKRKAASTFRKERQWRSHGTQPGSQKNTCESFKQSLIKFEEHIAAPNLSQPAPDENLNDLLKQGFSAIQEGNKKYQPYNVDIWNKVSFDIQPTNPRTNWHYGHRALWVLDHSHWSHGVSKKEYPILPRWYYASWSVHWHSSLYLQCRRKV